MTSYRTTRAFDRHESNDDLWMSELGAAHADRGPDARGGFLPEGNGGPA